MTTMTFEIGELRVIEAWLDEEFGLQEMLIERLRTMQSFIVKSDLAGLERYLVESTEILERMEAIDRRRRKIYGSILAWRGLAPGQGSLRRLADFAPPADRAAIEDRVERLHDAARQVRLHNNRNGMLARSALELTEDFVRAMFLVPAGAQTYDPKGRMKARPELILDRSL